MRVVHVEARFTPPAAKAGDQTRPKLYLFWHENLIVPAYCYAKLKVPVLVSNHRDGELVAQVVHCLGGETIRGSSTRGGAKALREMMQRIQSQNLAITPDGPRGPRRVLQPGAVFLASQAQIDIVPVGIHFSNPWRAKSWDRMAIPKPFSAAYVVAGEPLTIPPDLSKDQLEPYRQLCQAGMDNAQAEAERLGR